MTSESLPLVFQGAQTNYYVQDVEGLAAFYRESFGFKETYRNPQVGPPEHIELRLGDFVLGFASVEAGRTIHHLPLDPGKPRGEIVLWTNDVDQAYAMLTAKGVRCIRELHNFVVYESFVLGVAWFEDPEGNIFQIVCRRP